MWKKMMELETLIGSTTVGIIAFAVSWFGVTVLGWRYVDIVGLVKDPFDASQSIFAFTTFGFVILMPFACLALILARPLSVESQ